MRIHYTDSPFAVPAKPEDTFAYSCCRCGECCRNVRNAIFVSSLDAFRLARFLCVSMEELIRAHMVRFPIEPFDFPVLMLRAKSHRDACTFLYKGNCGVHEAKSLVCRLYPLNVQPGDNGRLDYALVSKKPVHYKGDPIRVDAWMEANLSVDDRYFMCKWYELIKAVRRKYLALEKRRNGAEQIAAFNSLAFHLLYEAIDPAAEFWPQYEANLTRFLAERGG